MRGGHVVKMGRGKGTGGGGKKRGLVFLGIGLTEEEQKMGGVRGGCEVVGDGGRACTQVYVRSSSSVGRRPPERERRTSWTGEKKIYWADDLDLFALGRISTHHTVS